MSDQRRQALAAWVGEVLGEQVPLAPIEGDASTRRYFRLRHGEAPLIAMDAPPESQDTGPFLDVARRLQAAGLNVPAIRATDTGRGFLLLGDLGRDTYIQVLDEANADSLFQPAIAAIVQMQRRADSSGLPPYDEALLRRELDLFPDWYLQRHLGASLAVRLRPLLERLHDRLLAVILAQPRVFVHRDFMPRNLVVSDPNPGIIDFQDAVCGPISYDPVCLFRDAFLSWPWQRVRDWQLDYWRAARAVDLPVPAREADFLRDCDYMAVQRHLKVIGIFARICHRDGKPRYLGDVPRFFAYLRESFGRNPELQELGELLRELGEDRAA